MGHLPIAPTIGATILTGLSAILAGGAILVIVIEVEVGRGG
ncbi:MAG: hypothetical protein AVDCRST_MAG18-2322 [uncultured Thermomicrobiales bacterium]|uniref:Uncharacterized protein n=1 Tax=uncultured Thermomicrobiales bacterium TaxID=1645740 RepID=A0A6J4VB87_9BACT|nr:MAG: hypothetical protein AVDCRST_MAG18-2322 [uncultured Thermomicrobiales bacterium]